MFDFREAFQMILFSVCLPKSIGAKLYRCNVLYKSANTKSYIHCQRRSQIVLNLPCCVALIESASFQVCVMMLDWVVFAKAPVTI